MRHLGQQRKNSMSVCSQISDHRDEFCVDGFSHWMLLATDVQLSENSVQSLTSMASTAYTARKRKTLKQYGKRKD